MQHLRRTVFCALGLFLPSHAGLHASPLRIEPLAPGARWTHGHPAMQATKDGLEVRAVYRDTADPEIVFDIEVTNGTASTVLIRPEDSFLFEDGANASPVDAIDPEAALLALDRERARLDAAEAARAGFGLAFALVDFVGTVAGLEDDETPEQTARDDAAYERARHALDLRRRVTAMTALRRTTLAPGESTRGELRFPPKIAAAATGLFVSAGWEQFEFRFQPHWPAGVRPAPEVQPGLHNDGWPRSAERTRPARP